MTKRFELECCGEPVTVVVDDDGVEFIGWDEDAELALIELGFEPSLCFVLADSMQKGGRSLALEKMLCDAARMGDVKTVDLCIAVGVNACPYRDYPMVVAIRHGDTAVVGSLLNGYCYDKGYFSAKLTRFVELAIQEGQTGIAETLLTCHPHINIDMARWLVPLIKYKPAHDIVFGGSADIVTFNNNVLKLASQTGHMGYVKRFLAAGADIHVDDDYPFRAAAAWGRADIVELLLAEGADVHAKDDQVRLFASVKGHGEVVAVLDDWVEEHG